MSDAIAAVSMLGRRWRSVLGLATAVAVLGLGWDDAGATTICVPEFRPDCPNSGGNKSVADLEKAMSLEASDGNADQVLIGAGTFTPDPKVAESFVPMGTDPLTVVGAGPAQTILTSTGTWGGNVVNLGVRPTTIRDLTVRIPASFEDGGGTGFTLAGNTVDNVDIVSRNKGSSGILYAYGPDNVFRNGEVRSESGGSIAIGLGNNTEGSLLAEDAKVIGAVWGLATQEKGAQLTARRVTVLGATSGAVSRRGSVKLENSVMETEGRAFYVQVFGAYPANLSADHVTVVDVAASEPAITVNNPAEEGDASVTVSNSILRGFASGYQVYASTIPGTGIASLAVRYSNLSATGTIEDNGTVDLGTGNIDADPILSDFMLPPGSPSIDAGDPAPGGLASDFAGAPRPVDGDGDGLARRDQGAYEYQRPPRITLEPPPKTGGGEETDKMAPKTTILSGPGKKLGDGVARFRFGSSEAGSSFECKLDKGRARRCGSPKRYTGLKAGRHTFKVWASDRAGNKDLTPAKRGFRVPAR